MSLFSPLLEAALGVASTAHQGQCRKGTALPYITHPVQVATILQRAGWTDEVVLAAALLHDVVEDTEVTLTQLAAQFPDRTVAIVAALSEQKTDAEGAARPWEDRKREYLERLATADVETRAVALADKLHNLRCLVADVKTDPAAWQRFNAKPDRLAWYHRAVADTCARGETSLMGLLRECNEAIADVERLLDSTGSA
ncbi:MAG: HD domain-containing protein [Planctomycetaceae bacterium]